MFNLKNQSGRMYRNLVSQLIMRKVDSFDSFQRKVHMQRVIGLVTMQWHAQKWHKTFLDYEQIYQYAIAHFLKYIDYYKPKVSNMWRAGELIQFIDVSARIAKRKRMIMLSSLCMKRYHFFLIPLLALWCTAPQQLLEVDPSLVLNPDIVGILRKAILHEGCPYKEISDLVVTDMTQCMCVDNPIHKALAEEFQQKQELITYNSIEEIRMNRIYPLVLAISTSILLSMLHSQVLQ